MQNLPGFHVFQDQLVHVLYRCWSPGGALSGFGRSVGRRQSAGAGKDGAGNRHLVVVGALKRPSEGARGCSPVFPQEMGGT